MHNYDNRNHYKIANIISFNRNYVKNGGKKKEKNMNLRMCGFLVSESSTV